MKHSILVTGAAGFIGSHVTDILIDQGHNVIALDDLSGGFEENVNPKAEFVKTNLMEAEVVDKVIRENSVDTVYHIAAYAAEGLSPFIKRFNYENNLISSVNLLNSSIRHGVKTFLFTSSMAVYGGQTPPFHEGLPRMPKDSYAIAKASVENEIEICHEMWGLDYVIIRPHNVYGERQNISDPYRNVIGIFMNRIMHGQPPLIYGDGEQTRAFSYIGDVASCIARAPFVKKALGQIINLGAADPFTINKLAEVVLEVMGSDLKPVHVPKRHEVKHAFCTTDKSVKILGYKTNFSLEAGVKRMADWAKKVGPQKPQVWDEYEIYKNIPPYWLDLVKQKTDKFTG